MATTSPSAAHPGLLNLRDLGGTPTRDGREVAPGRLLRAAEPSGCTVDELEQLRSLGVRSRIDLRSGPEPERGPCTEVDAAGVAVHHVPFTGLTSAEELPPMETPAELGRAYVTTIETNADGLRDALELFAGGAELGVLLHCAWGKDRAGMVTAATLELLGADRETIVADYARTETAVEALMARALSRVGSELTPAVDLERTIIRARPATLTAYLDELDRRHGGIAGLLAARGVDVDDLRGGLRDRLLA